MHRSVKIPAKKRISQTFGLKASKYDQYAEVQKKYQDYLKNQISKESPTGVWCDLGCGTGRLLSDLEKAFTTSSFVGIDIAFQSLQILRKNNPVITMIQGDIECLPLKGSSLDGVITSSVLQWIYDLDSFFSAIGKILKKNGNFFFSIFTTGSFGELSDARKSIGLTDPVSLPDTKQISALLEKYSFKEISLTEDEEIVYFPSARELLKSLSAIGSTAVAEKPMTRNQLHTFCQILESGYRTDRGVPLTYRSTLGCAKLKADL
jgi:malonyl-CoA O-methyltransferase